MPAGAYIGGLDNTRGKLSRYELLGQREQDPCSMLLSHKAKRL